jgi:hypothetical protein
MDRLHHFDAERLWGMMRHNFLLEFFYQCSTHLPGIKDEKSGVGTDSYPVCCIIFQVRYRFLPGLMGVVVFLFSLVIFAWGVWPVTRSSRQVTLHLPDGETADDAYKIDMIWPARLRQGDKGVIRLVLESGNDGIVAGGGPTLVESRLEAAGLAGFPVGAVLEPLLPGRQVIYHWSVLPEQSGEHEAVVWVSMLPVLRESEGSGALAVQQSQLLTAQKIQIHADDLFGLDGPMARWLGGTGSLIGLVFCLYWLVGSWEHIRKEVGSDDA